jgi:O-antigen ligase
MQTLLLIFWGLAFTLGQLGGVTIFTGVRLYLLDIATAVLLIYGAHNQREKKRLIPDLWAPILVFALVGGASVLINEGGVSQFSQAAGLLYLVRWLFYAALYWAAFSSKIAKEAWLRVLYWSGLAIAALGLVQYAWYPNLRNLYYLGWDPHFQRLFSTILDPNFAGLIFVLTLLIGLRLRASIWGQLLLVGSLLLTYSRSSYLALLVAGIVIALYDKRLRKPLGVALAVFMGLLVLLPKTGEGRNLLRQASVGARVENFQEGIALFGSSPIFGYGFNTLRYVPRLPTETRLAADESIPSLSAAGFDMSAVFILATTGIVGLAVYLWLLVKMFMAGKSDMYFIAGLAAVLTHSVFVNSLFYPWVMAVLWIWLGLTRASRAAR